MSIDNRCEIGKFKCFDEITSNIIEDKLKTINLSRMNMKSSVLQLRLKQSNI